MITNRMLFMICTAPHSSLPSPSNVQSVQWATRPRGVRKSKMPEMSMTKNDRVNSSEVKPRKLKRRRVAAGVASGVFVVSWILRGHGTVPFLLTTVSKSKTFPTSCISYSKRHNAIRVPICAECNRPPRRRNPNSRRKVVDRGASPWNRSVGIPQVSAPA